MKNKNNIYIYYFFSVDKTNSIEDYAYCWVILASQESISGILEFISGPLFQDLIYSSNRSNQEGI